MNAFATFEIIFASVIWTWIGWAWWQRRQAGALLLSFEPDQGPSLRPLLLVVAAVLAAVSLIIAAAVPDVTIDDLGRWLFNSSIPTLIASPMFLRPQLHQHGILVNSQLVRWNKINAYGWERNKRNELTLRLDTSLPFFAVRRIIMDAIYRDKVEALLAEHVGGSVREQ